jgi:hypothetical protein
MTNAWRMGDLAGEDSYDPMSGAPIGIASTYDPREDLPQWALRAAAHPEPYQPLTSKVFPDYKAPDETTFVSRFGGGLPTVGDAAIPSGPTWQGSERANRYADVASEAANDMLIPKTPTDIGLTLVPGGIARKAVGGAIGSLFDSDPAEAASIRKVLSATSHLDLARPNPNDFHRIANAKLRRPLADIPVETTGSTPGSTLVNPAWLEGAVMTPLVGDPTVRGLTINKIDNVPLSKPLETQGGHGYIRDTEGYANDGGLATTLGNRVKGLQQDFGTDRIIGAYTKMGPQSGDFSHHNWGAVARMLPNSEIATRDVGKLNTAIRTEIANVPRTEAMIESGRGWNFPRFPGIKYADLEQHLAENADPYRKAFLRALEKNRDIPGTPDVVAARYAVTDPRLLDAPAGASGLSMTQLTGDVVPGSHPDFPRHLTGKGNWTLGGSVRQEVMFPDMIERFDKTQPPDRWARKMYMAPDKGKLHGQLADARWVDNTSQYQADVQQMGEAAAFDKYLRHRFGWSD